MAEYFRRMENCHYQPLQRWLAKLGINPSKHGWTGWLHTEKAEPLATYVTARSEMSSSTPSRNLTMLAIYLERLDSLFDIKDPNDWRQVSSDSIGARCVPLTTRNHSRFGTREYLLETRRKYPTYVSS